MGKNAASVFPVPVGEQTKTLRRWSASGIASRCGVVGEAKCSAHHAATCGCSAAKTGSALGMLLRE